METLNDVKASSSRIDLSLQESAEVKEQLLKEYEQYKEICSKSAKLFVGINKIHFMPVNVFTQLYVKSVSSDKVRNSCFV